jgi:phosphatidylserine decarboxylase
MKYILRERDSNKNIILESNKTLNFFYNNFFGRIVLKIFISKPFNKLVGLYMNSRLSINRINKYIKKNNIDLKEYEQVKYKSYNEFFTKKILSNKRPINMNENILISPCDSKISIYTINEDLTLRVKDSYYNIDTLVGKNIISEYVDGYALVFRLSEKDYHRYCYIDNGKKSDNIHINGVFHTVQKISLDKYNFYKTNDREYTILNTNNFDKIVEVEIGAMCIGKIKNLHKNYKFKKGEEKGYFEFGGSTIVLLIKKNIVDIDKDILDNSKNDIETIVKYGERIGIKKNT